MTGTSLWVWLAPLWLSPVIYAVMVVLSVVIVHVELALRKRHRA